MIAFFGEEKDWTLSANLAAFSSLGVMMGHSVVVAENRNKNRYTEKCLFGEPEEELSPVSGYYYETGRMGGLPGGSRMIPVWDENFFYLSQQRYLSSRVFEYEFERFLDCLPELDRYCELLIIGAVKGAALTGDILDRADVVVAQLEQRPECFDEFILNYPSLLTRTVFLISGYQKKAEFDRDRAARLFHLDKSRIAAAPHDEEYYRYASGGDTMRFIRRYFHCGNRSRHYSFLYGMKAAFKRMEEVLAERKGILCTEDLRNRPGSLSQLRLRPEYF